MKRMLPKGMVIVLVVMLLLGAIATATTLLHYSAGAAAQKLAVAALQEKYGLTRSSLGLFTAEYTEDEQGMHVWYRANAYLPKERVGDYHVLIVGGEAKATWTHDDKDRSLWESGAPESPCWGEKQLQACLAAANPVEWLRPYLAEDTDNADPPNIFDTLDFAVVEPETDDLPFREAQALADAALMDFYGMSAEEVARYDHYLDPRMLLCGDGRRLWEVTIADADNCFQVLVDAKTGEIFHISLTTGGVG